MQRKTNIIEDTSITCADDDVLADILGELHTQLNKSVPSKTHKTSKAVKKTSPKRKTGAEGTAIAKNVETSLEYTEDVSMETVAMVTIEHVDKSISSSPGVKNMDNKMAENDEFLSDKNFDYIPDDDSFMDVAANLPTTESQELCEEFNSLSPFKILPRYFFTYSKHSQLFLSFCTHICSPIYVQILRIYIFVDKESCLPDKDVCYFAFIYFHRVKLNYTLVKTVKFVRWHQTHPYLNLTSIFFPRFFSHYFNFNFF